MELPNLWRLSKADLERARNMLPKDVPSRKAMDLYQRVSEKNELGLACVTLEERAENQQVGKKSSLALRDAATRMKLSDQASRYEKYAQNQ